MNDDIVNKNFKLFKYDRRRQPLDRGILPRVPGAGPNRQTGGAHPKPKHKESDAERRCGAGGKRCQIPHLHGEDCRLRYGNTHGFASLSQKERRHISKGNDKLSGR